MEHALVLITAVAYVLLLVLTGVYARRSPGRAPSWRGLSYALSIAVYCTGWTFYGSVGLAAKGNWGFLPVYLGPTLCAAAWMLVLRKLIIVSKHHRISSVSDLLSARFGGDRTVGMLAAGITAITIIPYISIQLKVVAESFALLQGGIGAQLTPQVERSLLEEPSFYLTLLLMGVCVLVGTRRLDATERSGGLSAALAVEALFKLGVFLAVGFYVTYGYFDGWSSLWQAAEAEVDLSRWLSIGAEKDLGGWSWAWLNLISAMAVLLLPRQFHVAVVGNESTQHVRTASWVFPLYLLLINAFVVPIALAGLTVLGDRVPADLYVLALPLEGGADYLAGLVLVAGFSAATAMILVSTVALSLMLVNNVISPLLLARPRWALWRQDLPERILGLRRITIVILLLISYAYYILVAEYESLISIGLISFAGIAQLGPPVLASLYWRRVSRSGVLAGLAVGFLVWGYLLPFSSLVAGIVESPDWITSGPFGISWLAPGNFLGLDSGHVVARAAFWSLLGNTAALVWFSLRGERSPTEIAKADEFVNVERYTSVKTTDGNVIRKRQLSGGSTREAQTSDLLLLLHRYLGSDAAIERVEYYQQIYNVDPRALQTSSERFVSYVERSLAGAVGSPSARLAVSSISRSEMAKPLLQTLDEARELQSALTKLEAQRMELEQTADELREANAALRELDELKEEFVSTVSHELRTPITSIRAMTQLLSERPDLPVPQRERFQATVLAECDRLVRLVGQVLNARAAENLPVSEEAVPIAPCLMQAFAVAVPLAEEAGIVLSQTVELAQEQVCADPDRIIQVLVNLLGNSLKFTDRGGQVLLKAYATKVGIVRIEVRDTGRGIPEERQAAVFEKFSQADFQGAQKPVGNGLGLYISRVIVEHYGGSIGLRSVLGQGTTVWVELPVASETRNSQPVS